LQIPSFSASILKAIKEKAHEYYLICTGSSTTPTVISQMIKM